MPQVSSCFARINLTSPARAQIVPGTLRPDGTRRKDRRVTQQSRTPKIRENAEAWWCKCQVKMGYVPQEEQKAWASRGSAVRPTPSMPCRPS